VRQSREKADGVLAFVGGYADVSAYRMCGRYAITTAPEAIRQLFGYLDRPNFPPRYNVAPTQPIAIVRLEEGKRRFALVRWGLIPSWVKDPKTFSLVINARGESVIDRPAFRNAMKYRRCLIPADGFYEWKPEGRGKQPYFVRLKSGEPFAFAGLWDIWTGPNGEELETAAIITTDACRDIAHIHDRMPVILPQAAYDVWLDCHNVDAQTAAGLIAPTSEGALEAYPVSTMVNRVANDSAELIARAAPHVAAEPQDTAGPGPKKPAKKKDARQAELF
jgi:putative SOS response-associated peptidase YedK